MISLRNPKADSNEPQKQFTFDAVFGPSDSQKHIYDVCAFSMVESVLNGYNGTFFAYGQVRRIVTQLCACLSDSYCCVLLIMVIDWFW